MNAPDFLTAGKNLRTFSTRSGGRCLWLATSPAAALGQVWRRRGLRGVLKALTERRPDDGIEALAMRNLVRRRIRWPAIFRWKAVCRLYLFFTILHARLIAAAFEDALAARPSADVLVHNGFLLPHSLLAAVARRTGRTHCFLEGGFFPGTFQCDTQGINFDGSLPRDAAFYRNVELRPDELALPDSLVTRATKLKDTGSAELPEHFVFVPFQVPSDMQILALSPWIRDMRHLYEVVERLAERFADRRFVIKEHPSFPLSIRGTVRQHPRIGFANHESTRLLIERSQAVITVNSTVGLEALLLKKKVITLGNAHYNIEGLVMPAGDDAELAAAFRALDTWEQDPALRETFLAYVHNVFLRHGMLDKPSPAVLDAIKARMERTDRHAQLTAAG